FLLGVVSGSGCSLQGTLAQGYEGLFGDDSGGGSASRRADEPLGYQGLIPGQVPQAAPQQAAPGYPQVEQRRRQADTKTAPARRAPVYSRNNRSAEGARTAGMTPRPGYKRPGT